MTDYKVVRMGLSGLSYQDHYHLGQLIRKTADELNRKVVIIASGDLSHKLKESGPYGYVQEGPEFDHKVIEALSHGKFLDLMTIWIMVFVKEQQNVVCVHLLSWQVP